MSAAIRASRCIVTRGPLWDREGIVVQRVCDRRPLVGACGDSTPAAPGRRHPICAAVIARAR